MCLWREKKFSWGLLEEFSDAWQKELHTGTVFGKLFMSDTDQEKFVTLLFCVPELPLLDASHASSSQFLFPFLDELGSSITINNCQIRRKAATGVNFLERRAKPNTTIFSNTYNYKNLEDDSLGPEGDLRVYLEGLALAENVQEYVKNHPFGQRPIITQC
ncbi:hypothetical protein POM88_000244 [Heracleum sosnowskyi]|uniref:Uncharacterized protein n=1 Tax=Heracleum sosnowskyi TaxID=360622 RepID=A0AAD8N8I8_9APIA|nr:hypothetical protein POM88_000244 [Heracleum sosnowskyi]